ncbi:YidC/Oxa1 family membrane protein insertase [Lacisediminihabitans sp.]|jgi:YidC/Oxa1 family membrane protein insertase|uniref:YidC/Oxa1 family membrane protein insertase n=1 Tax=Lacisediminihabitans sp. TaxID=2787631 RepID=UPI002F931083
MDLFSFAPIAAIFDVAYAAVEGLAALFTPVAGAASAALAIVALTILVRLALIPVGVSQVKAEGTRRRLTPQLQALQRRHKKNPALLQQKTAELFKAERSSQFAGILPALAQAPVLSLVYALFLRTTVDGHPNGLLAEHLFGVPLGTSFVHLLSGGTPWPGAAVYLGLFAVMAAVAWLSRRIALELMLPNPDAAPGTESVGRALSWLGFITVVFAAFVPLAATLYLAATTVWTLGERQLLRRLLWRGSGLPGSTGATAAIAG